MFATVNFYLRNIFAAVNVLPVDADRFDKQRKNHENYRKIRKHLPLLQRSNCRWHPS